MNQNISQPVPGVNPLLPRAIPVNPTVPVLSQLPIVALEQIKEPNQEQSQTIPASSQSTNMPIHSANLVTQTQTQVISSNQNQATNQIQATLSSPPTSPLISPQVNPQIKTTINPTISSSPTTPQFQEPSQEKKELTSETSTNSIINQGFKNTILEELIKSNKLTLEQAQEINTEHLSSGKSFEKIIDEKKIITELQLVKAKANLQNIPFVDLKETGVSPAALTKLDQRVAARYKAFPFALNEKDGVLFLAMADPTDLTAIQFIEQKTGMNVKVHYALPDEIEAEINTRYAQSLSSDVTAAIKDTGLVKEGLKKDLKKLAGAVIREAPINRIVDTILEFALKSGTSDVHIEPLVGRTRVRYRIDGILREKLVLPQTVHEAVVSRIKILSNLKIDEKRIPQDGRFNFKAAGLEVDLRVSTLPTIHGEKVVMRLLKKEMKVPTLEELGLSGVGLTKLKDSIRVPHGIILITGPTGSGKTTTLYSMLNILNEPKVNIMTLEDPVEYEMPGINQVQVNAQAGLTFASGLRSFLRQDPNIMMVGEIRDLETARLAVQASLTGHLVFSTLHTNSAAGALPRMMDMGIEPFLLASSITLVMAQRVTRRLNAKFIEAYKPEKAVLEDIKNVLGDHFTEWCSKKNIQAEEVVLYKIKEDRPQEEPEYKGRIGIYEIMPVTEELSRLIMDRKPGIEMEKLAQKQGMLLMKQDGYLKALDGVTTIEEVLRVAEI